MKAGGGLITAADLAKYECKDREPLLTNYHGYEIISSPPPCSGGIVLVEILNILYDFDSPGSARPLSAQVQLITEAFRRAYMDRGDYLGDPDFNKFPSKKWQTRSTPPPGAINCPQTHALRQPRSPRRLHPPAPPP